MAEDSSHKQGDGEHGHGHGPGRYVVVWLLLLVATATTVITGRMDLHGANLPIALIIAVTKSTLVVLFFMHLWDSEGINRLVFSVSVVFVIVLILGVFGDVLTRLPSALPGGVPPTEAEIEKRHEAPLPAHGAARH